jgi:hypothetical protein
MPQILPKNPCSQIDLAVSMEELNSVKDLVEGTLFKINLDDYLNGEGMITLVLFYFESFSPQNPITK